MVSVHQKLVLGAICIIEGIELVKRICIICGKEFDTKNRSPSAKTCSKECSMIYRKEYHKQYNKQWYQNNCEYKKQYNRQWRQDNPEYHKQWRQDNREYCKQYAKQWRQDNPKYKKQWYQDNREHALEQSARYVDQHPEKYRKTKREEETPGLDVAKKMARQNANYQCELTGWKGPNNVHHLNGYVCFPNQRADLNNLIVLATDVHKHFHRIYGKNGDNTIEQFDEFVCDWFPLQVDNFRMNKYKYLPEHTYNT